MRKFLILMIILMMTLNVGGIVNAKAQITIKAPKVLSKFKPIIDDKAPRNINFSNLKFDVVYGINQMPTYKIGKKILGDAYNILKININRTLKK